MSVNLGILNCKISATIEEWIRTPLKGLVPTLLIGILGQASLPSVRRYGNVYADFSYRVNFLVCIFKKPYPFIKFENCLIRTIGWNSSNKRDSSMTNILNQLTFTIRGIYYHHLSNLSKQIGFSEKRDGTCWGTSG